jgi:hypothetical protein
MNASAATSAPHTSNATVIASPATGRVIASCFALSAFAIALFAGLYGGNDGAQILLRAVMAMIVCYLVGAVVGMICDGVIHSHVTTKSVDAVPHIAHSTDVQEAEVVGSVGVVGGEQQHQAARMESVAAKSRAAA